MQNNWYKTYKTAEDDANAIAQLKEQKIPELYPIITEFINSVTNIVDTKMNSVLNENSPSFRNAIQQLKALGATNPQITKDKLLKPIASEVIKKTIEEKYSQKTLSLLHLNTSPLKEIIWDTWFRTSGIVRVLSDFKVFYDRLRKNNPNIDEASAKKQFENENKKIENSEQTKQKTEQVKQIILNFMVDVLSYTTSQLKNVLSVNSDVFNNATTKLEALGAINEQVTKESLLTPTSGEVIKETIKLGAPTNAFQLDAAPFKNFIDDWFSNSGILAGKDNVEMIQQQQQQQFIQRGY